MSWRESCSQLALAGSTAISEKKEIMFLMSGYESDLTQDGSINRYVARLLHMYMMSTSTSTWFYLNTSCGNSERIHQWPCIYNHGLDLCFRWSSLCCSSRIISSLQLVWWLQYQWFLSRMHLIGYPEIGKWITPLEIAWSFPAILCCSLFCCFPGICGSTLLFRVAGDIQCREFLDNNSKFCFC